MKFQKMYQDLSINFIIFISSNITNSEIDLVNNRISYNGLTAMVFIPVLSVL